MPELTGQSEVMNRNKIVMITSCKGGVGKSTICANLGLALAKRGKKVLLCDCDFGMKCLDLLTGHENEMLFSFYDAIVGRVELDRVFLKDGRAEDLRICLAPDEIEGANVTPESFIRFLAAAAAKYTPDYILLDTPGDLSHPFHLAAAAAGRAIVISTHQPTAIRAAEKTADMLSKDGVQPSLIINCFETERSNMIHKGKRAGLLEMIDRTSAGLLGVIPYSDSLALAQESGMLADEAGKNDFIPFRNIAARMCGENLPLFTGLRHRKKLKRSVL